MKKTIAAFEYLGYTYAISAWKAHQFWGQSMCTIPFLTSCAEAQTCLKHHLTLKLLQKRCKFVSQR